MDTEVAGHLCHTQPDRRCIVSQAFQPKGKLMPDLVRNDLVLRVLQDIADLLALGTHIHLSERYSIIKDFAGALTVQRKHTL